MDKELEKKELGLLMKAKLRPYTVDTFKKYWTHEDDYKSKKAGPVNRIYIAVYSIWHKRLLARVFYFEEYMRYKKISRQLFEVQRQVAGMSEKMIMKKDGYVIKPLLMPKELREEGKKMHHCVGSYAEKVATGECLIFSVRKEEDIERPLATIEIQEKKVKQVRAAYNNEPPEDVSVFVKKWEKKFRLSGW